jgi:hypothetical protein
MLLSTAFCALIENGGFIIAATMASAIMFMANMARYKQRIIEINGQIEIGQVPLPTAAAPSCGGVPENVRSAV